MTLASGTLLGLRMGISISESDELEARGFTPAGMNRLTVRFNDAFLSEGATLAFGHDWRQEGIMDAVCRSALASFGFPEAPAPRPLILNLIPWPDQPRVEPEILARLRGILEIREARLPPDLQELALAPEAVAGSDLWTYLRSRGLTYLRRQLIIAGRARICLGGRERGFSGRYPGVLEEALMALRAGQPVYFVGLLGGVSQRVGQAILLKRLPELIVTEDQRRLEGIYARRSSPSWSADPLDDDRVDPKGAWESALRFKSEELAAANGLSVAENRRLLETPFEEEAIDLVLRGLRRITSSRPSW
jgi:hypothetical protein